MPLPPEYADLAEGMLLQSVDKHPSFHVFDNLAVENLGKSHIFSMSPSVIHFGGFTTGDEQRQTLSIVNISATSRRMVILPPEPNGVFQINYTNSGTLAPGMAQKVEVIFRPREYRYYYDCIRVKSEEQSYVIPFHGYPIMNKVEFPREIKLGDAPLCEEVVRRVSLRCSVPIAFYFEIQVQRPHPYFRIWPLSGVVPPNGSVDVSVAFSPITLGTCATTIKLYVGQHGYVPFETVISSRAVSGAIEKRTLTHTQSRVADFAIQRGSSINQLLGGSTFRGELTLKQSLDDTNAAFAKTAAFSRANLLLPGRPKHHSEDPIAKMLAATFRAHDVSGALDSSLAYSASGQLLGSKRKLPVDTGALQGVTRVIGESVTKKPVTLRGMGSGNVFDAGVEWMTMTHRKQYDKQKQKQKQAGTTAIAEEEGEEVAVVEGLRVPRHLDTPFDTNFVITQEAGKLKPKDLKAAIETNRAKKKARAEEQQRIREQGGGVGSGLDLRAVLAEEQLNTAEGDAFKRQLREMAFLADVDDVAKLETEKAFRTSEQYLGSLALSPEEIEVIESQRRLGQRYTSMAAWRRVLARQRTELFVPHHVTQKAGSLKAIAAPPSDEKFLPADVTGKLTFDINRNDVWAMRLNTQRRLIAVVSKWVTRRRASIRLERITKRLREAGVTDRESCKQFVARENAERMAADTGAGGEGKKTADGATKGESGAQSHGASSVAALVCAMPYQPLLNRLAGDLALTRNKVTVSSTMCRRVLFPKYSVSESAERSPLDPTDIRSHSGFDDRTFFQTKVRQEYLAMGYSVMAPPAAPLGFPLCSGKALREGAPEESVVRSAADNDVSPALLADYLPPAAAGLKALLQTPLAPEVAPCDVEDEASWLAAKPSFSLHEVNFMRPRPDLRTYVPVPKRKETDVSWVLRPFGEELVFNKDPSFIGSLLSSASGFQSAHRYLLKGYEVRSGVEVPPASGPTLVDFYAADTDRHGCGLFSSSRDHERSLHSHDPDVPALAAGQERDDVLTDSESDDDEAYQKTFGGPNAADASAGPSKVPSLNVARMLLRAPPPVEEKPAAAEPAGKGGKGGKAAAPPTKAAPAPAAAAAAPPTDVSAADSFKLADADRRGDQVELMRDRKVLDMEDMFRKRRYRDAEAITEKLVAISEASRCKLLAVRVQRPFHMYEEELYAEMGRIMPEPQSVFVEPSSGKHQGVGGAHGGLRSMELTGGSLMGSPDGRMGFTAS